MNFWARRPFLTNLFGAILVLLLWTMLTVPLYWIFPTSSFWSQRLPYITLLVAIIAITRLYDKMPSAWAGIGLHRWTGRELGQGILLGIAMAVIAWAITVPFTSVTWGAIEPSDSYAGSINGYFYWITFIILGAAGEELLFRGYLFQRAIEMIGVTAATLLSSSLFALAHLRNPDVSTIAIVNIFLAGIFFSLCYIRTGSLWLPIGAHAAWNLVLAKVFGTPVSGLWFGSSFLSTGSDGPAFWTGGAFGPEGGIATTIALIAGGIVLWRSSAITYSPYVHATIFRAFYNHERRHTPQSHSNT